MDNWHLKQIPKICHTYWGGTHLIYMRYLTIRSFIKYNPDWKVVLWYPKRPHMGEPSWNYMKGMPKVNERVIRNYLPELYKLPIELKEIDFEALGFPQNMPEVHKADFIRINSLFQIGGMWTDMDIIYFKPISVMKANIPENSDKEVFVCISPYYGHSTGFNMAKPGSQFFKKLTEVFNDDFIPRNYQCWGPDIFNKYFKTIDLIPSGINLDMDVVYAYDCHHVKEILKRISKRFTDGSIGCHWYGGNVMWTQFINSTYGGERNLPNTIIGNIIKNESK